MKFHENWMEKFCSLCFSLLNEHAPMGDILIKKSVPELLNFFVCWKKNRKNFSLNFFCVRAFEFTKIRKICWRLQNNICEQHSFEWKSCCNWLLIGKFVWNILGNFEVCNDCSRLEKFLSKISFILPQILIEILIFLFFSFQVSARFQQKCNLWLTIEESVCKKVFKSWYQKNSSGILNDNCHLQ